MRCRSVVVSEYGPAENLILTEKELPPLEEQQVRALQTDHEMGLVNPPVPWFKTSSSL